ncbi:hypothetical protein ECG581_4943, partial [Escherichia coli G58-1]
MTAEVRAVRRSDAVYGAEEGYRLAEQVMMHEPL